MSPEEDPKTNPGSVEAAQTERGPEGRRPGRGRRGRGRHRRRKPSQAEPASEQQKEHELREEAAIPAPEQTEPLPVERSSGEEFGSREPEPEPEEHEFPTVPAPPSSTTIRAEEAEKPATLQDAIDNVNDIIETLRQSLDEMEELLELLEVFERQTGADQREIDSLRRALKQLHRPRDGGREGGREGAHGHHR